MPNAQAFKGCSNKIPALFELLDTYKNGRRVRERLWSWELERGKIPKEGEIRGSGLGGAATGRRGNRFMLTVRVRWDDGTEDLSTHWGLIPV